MTNNKPAISVIMPIYNGEKFLPASLGSIFAQTFKDFEILLINDGSTDASEKICQSFVEQDLRARYFYKKNGGVSSARNLGLEKVLGKFIYFFDCDDIIAPDALEFLVNLQKDTGADIVVCASTNVFEQVIPAAYKVTQSALATITTAENKWEKPDIFYCLLGCKLFSRKVIGDIRFSEKICYGEDNLFQTEVFINADKVAYEPVIKVFYYLHDESATHKAQQYSFFQGFVLAKWLMKEKIYTATNNTKARHSANRGYCISIIALFRYVVRVGDKKEYEVLQKKYAKRLGEFIAKEEFSIWKKLEYKTYIKSYKIARLIHARKI